jgi:hypothetical protein
MALVGKRGPYLALDRTGQREGGIYLQFRGLPVDGVFCLMSWDALRKGQSGLCASMPRAAFASQNKQ